MWRKTPVARAPKLSGSRRAEAAGTLDRSAGGEQPGLHGGGQPREGRGADQRPVRAVGGVVAGDRVSVAGQPQPARRGRGHAAGQAGGVVDVVPLHPHAVGPGDHHRRVRRALRGVLLDDDPGLGPRLQATWRRLEPAVTCADDESAGQRRHLHGDRAVPGHRLVREVEHVLDRLTARPGRLCRAGGVRATGRVPATGRAAPALTSAPRNAPAAIATIVTSTAITQPRTVRNLVHSACTRCQKLSRSGVSRGAMRCHGLRSS